jgi:hypothetical protein
MSGWRSNYLDYSLRANVPSGVRAWTRNALSVAAVTAQAPDAQDFLTSPGDAFAVILRPDTIQAGSVRNGRLVLGDVLTRKDPQEGIISVNSNRSSRADVDACRAANCLGSTAPPNKELKLTGRLEARKHLSSHVNRVKVVAPRSLSAVFGRLSEGAAGEAVCGIMCDTICRLFRASFWTPTYW